MSDHSTRFESSQYRPTRDDMPIPFALRLDYDADFLPDGSIVERGATKSEAFNSPEGGDRG